MLFCCRKCWDDPNTLEDKAGFSEHFAFFNLLLLLSLFLQLHFYFLLASYDGVVVVIIIKRNCNIKRGKRCPREIGWARMRSRVSPIRLKSGNGR